MTLPSLGHRHEAVDPLAQSFRPEQLREDLQFARRELEDRHPGLYRFTPKDSLDAAFERTYGLLNHPLREDDFLRLLAPLVATVRCAHTAVRPSEAYAAAMGREARLMPFVLTARGGHLYALSGLDDAAPVIPGSLVLSINEVPVEAVLARMLASVSADGYNETYKYHQINRDLALAYATWIDRPDAFELRLRSPGNELYDVRAAAAPSHDVARAYAPTNERTEPASGLPLSYAYVEDARTAVLGVRSFWAPDPEQFIAYLADVFGDLRRQGAEHLVVDLRGNTGGFPLLAAELLTYLADTSFVYFARSDDAPVEFPTLYELASPSPSRFEGDVYVLVDGACVSTAAHFLSLIRYHRWGTLVGEESGGSYYCHDNSVQVVLPNTGIQLNIPQRTYQTAVTGFEEGRGIEPDWPVTPTLHDLLEHADAEMTYVMTIIAAGPAHS